MQREKEFEGWRGAGGARLRWVVLAALTAAAAACGSSNKTDTDNPPLGGEDAATVEPPDTGTPPPPPAGPVATDSQAVEAMKVANQAVLDVAQLAKTKAPHPDVLEYADRMILERGLANGRLDALITALALKPAPSDLSQGFRAQADADLLALQTAPGFDLAYLESQVTFHTAVLEALDATLIPKAKDQRVKFELMNQRDEVENHLGVAQAIVADLTGGPRPPPPADAGTTEPPDAGTVSP